MNSEEQPAKYQDLPVKAQRAVCIIRIAMAVMIVTPFVVAWLAGAIRF